MSFLKERIKQALCGNEGAGYEACQGFRAHMSNTEIPRAKKKEIVELMVPVALSGEEIGGKEAYPTGPFRG